jgi:hypothetical protein
MRVYVHLYVAITHKYLLLHYRRTLGIVVMGWCFEMEIRREAGSDFHSSVRGISRWR